MAGISTLITNTADNLSQGAGKDPFKAQMDVNACIDAIELILLNIQQSCAKANYPQLGGAAAGTGVSLAAAGSDTNIALTIAAKGSSDIILGGLANTIHITSTATGTAPVISAVGDTNRNLIIAPAGSGDVVLGSLANTIHFTPVATANNPVISPAGDANLGINFTASGTGVISHVMTQTITGGVTDGYAASLRLTPTYTAGTAQTVTRHNYFDINDVTLAGVGPAALTDSTLFRFNAAAGTHKCVDAGTTKTTPTVVTQWIKVNVNGTLAYIPSYSSKTS